MMCEGCERDQIHKTCPAWGTDFYMSGVPFTMEIEEICRRHAPPRTKKYNDIANSIFKLLGNFDFGEFFKTWEKLDKDKHGI